MTCGVAVPRTGDEQRASFGGRRAAEVRAGAADERPAAAPAGLRVDRDAGHGERLEVSAGGALGDLELVGELGRGDTAPRLEDQQGRGEAVRAH